MSSISWRPDFDQINSCANGHLTWVGWVNHSWRFGHAKALRKVGPKMPERGSYRSRLPVVWATFGIFSARSKWFPVELAEHGRDLVISLWSGDNAIMKGVAALLPTRKNPLVNFSPLFFGIMMSSSLYLLKDQTINAEYYSFLLVQLKDILKENTAGGLPGLSCSCMTVPRLTDHLQPRRNWPTWASSVLITHPILRIWPRRTTTSSMDWKSN